MKYILLILFCAGIYYFYPFSIEEIYATWSKHTRISYSFLGSLVLFFILNKNSKIVFVATFFHELMHATVALLTGGNVRSFNAGQGSGAVHHSSSSGRMNDLITIAPYNLPLIPLVWLLFVYLAKGHSISLIFSYLFGISLGFYVVRVFFDARPYQSDLKKLSLPVAYLLILVGNLFFLLFISNILKIA